MTFRILSLDGGGIRGVLSATLLKQVEKIVREKTGQELHQYFDLIAGTSTGSIIAAGIACKINADELVKIYQKEGKNLFPERIRGQRKWRFFSQLFGNHVLYPHEYGDQGLINVLKRNLIDKESGKCLTIRDIQKPQLLILSYDLFTRNTTWFANDDETEWYYDNDLKLWEICTASSSAPTFFPPYKIFNPRKQKSLPHTDGGVSANNPNLAAIAHALLMKKNDPQETETKLDEIAVLSIGTGRTTRPYTYDQVKKWGALGWIQHLPDLFLDPSSEISEEVSYRLFRSIESNKYLRLDFDLNKRPEGEKEVYNEYILKRDKSKEEVCEDIDNPEACKQLIKAAECYLDCGEVHYGGDWVPVQSAIEQFVESYQDKDVENNDNNNSVTESLSSKNAP